MVLTGSGPKSRQAHAINAEISDFSGNHMGSVQELMHMAAYGASSPLGAPLMAKPSATGSIDSDVLAAFVAEQFVPGKMVIAAAGYDHAELVALAKAHFGSLPAGPATVAGGDKYLGGEIRVSAEDACTHFALGFEGGERVPRTDLHSTCHENAESR